MTVKVCFVEDDPILGKSINQMLTLSDFEVNWSQRYKDAETLIIERNFDCYVLDIGLPDGSGLNLCKVIREIDSIKPILFLTAQTDEDTLLEAFRLGANDFLKKPFSHKELFARLKALTRNLSSSEKEIICGDLRLSLDDRELRFRGETLLFNNTEMQILYYLISNAEKVVTREKLLKYLGKENEVFDRTIDSHISHIRKQFKTIRTGMLHIRSIYGVGYKFEIE
jgi:DNA-binding response OmpR family regulator